MFDIQQSILQDEEINEGLVDDYISGLVDEFAASEEAKPFADSLRGIGWTSVMLEYAINYCGVTPAQMTVGEFKEVLFDLFPHKVSTEAENAAEIVAELQAIWRFAQRQYQLPVARQILKVLDDSATSRLFALMNDPANFGMAKSIFMLGQRSGYDMTTQDGAGAFMDAYNKMIAQQPLPPRLASDDWLVEVPSSPLTHNEKQKKRKERKRERQARKRNRR
jgi:hypothetical protein